MLELFLSSDRWFTGAMTIVGMLMLVMSIVSVRDILTRQSSKKIHLVKEFGLLALIVGIVGSAIDMMAAFDAIKVAAGISLSLMAAALKQNLVMPTYGLMIYGLSILIAMGLRWKVAKLNAEIS